MAWHELGSGQTNKNMTILQTKATRGGTSSQSNTAKVFHFVAISRNGGYFFDSKQQSQLLFTMFDFRVI